jgi:SAM-dependent methyltransferase
MSQSAIRRETCRLCGGRHLEVVLPIAATPPGDHYVAAAELRRTQETYPLDLVLCRDCGLAQLAYTVDPDVLYGRYVYTTSTSLGLVDHFRQYADSVLSRINPPAGAMVVDIGSNDGSLLRCFKELGMRVLGLDPAGDIARLATESGIETWNGYFNIAFAQKIKEQRGPATIVTANNVFANVDNLVEFTEGIRHLLAPDGVFVFETSYLLDVVEKSLVETIFHEHLSYLSAKPLDTFFRRLGLQLIDVERVPTKGGSLRGIVQLAGGPRPVSPAVGALLDREKSVGLDQPEIFKTFGSRLDALKTELLSLLSDLKAKGKEIAGYGASVGVTTLLYHLDVAKLLSFIVDDNPRKHNTFSPGHHIPVLPSEVLYERKQDYVLILSWNYAEPIMKKHRAYSDAGGHFILPLPRLEVR